MRFGKEKREGGRNACMSIAHPAEDRATIEFFCISLLTMSGSAAQQEEYLNRLRSQVQMQTVQEMMNKMSEKCFKVCRLTLVCMSLLLNCEYPVQLCAGKRGNHLDSSEANCVVNCMDRYMETMHVVSQAVSARSDH